MPDDDGSERTTRPRSRLARNAVVTAAVAALVIVVGLVGLANRAPSGDPQTSRGPQTGSASSTSVAGTSASDTGSRPPDALAAVGGFQQVGSGRGNSAVATGATAGSVVIATAFGQISAGGCAAGVIGSVGATKVDWRPAPGSVDLMASSGSVLLAVGRDADCHSATFASHDAGATWIVTRQAPAFRPTVLRVTGASTFVAAGPTTLWTSDDGVSWRGLDVSEQVLGATPAGMLVGSDGSHLATSTDSGATWQPAEGRPIPASISSAAIGETGVLLGTDGGAWFTTLTSSAEPARLSTGRVIATAQGGRRLAALEVDGDQVRLVLSSDTGDSQVFPISAAGARGSAALTGSLALGSDRIVIALADPVAAEQVIVFSANLNPR